jgi:hypothetical protein
VIGSPEKLVPDAGDIVEDAANPFDEKALKVTAAFLQNNCLCDH